jgi:hypothetical protein
MWRRIACFILFFAGCSLAVLGFTNAPQLVFSQAGTTTAPTGEWRIVPSPNTTAQQLLSVDCVSPSDCWAVGYFAGVSGVLQTLVQHWDGNAWVVVSSPNTNTDEENYLRYVDCTSSSDCWAVGYHIAYVNVGGTTRKFRRALTEHWNGTQWSIVAAPEPGSQSSLFGVTCTSSTNCWTVGRFYDGTTSGYDRTLVEHWDGVQWLVVSAPNSSSDERNRLLRVACTSASDCTAVGDRSSSTGDVTLIQHWDGIAWLIVDSPNASPQTSSYLSGIACVSSSDCWAVGYSYDYNDDVSQTLTEHWDGTAWSIISSPSTGPSDIDYLNDVRCNSTAQCWAVGYEYGAVEHGLLLQWNGSSWSLTTPPSSAASEGYFLNSITCTSNSDCWNVGFTYPDRTLTEHWNGSEWSIVSSPSVAGGGTDRLNDIACVTSSNCWAVGSNNSDIHIQHWDGTTWSKLSMLPYLGYQPQLYGVTCVTASDCWAVGDVLYNGSIHQTMALHWNGSEWSKVATVNPSQSDSYSFRDIACNGSNDCWAVGEVAAGSFTSGFIEHWNGISWTMVTSPWAWNALQSVTCNSVVDCWAVGGTTIAHGDGVTWTEASSPAVSGARLQGITCISSFDCWAVGEVINGAPYTTLIEHWDGVSWSVVPSPNTSGYNELNKVSCPSTLQCWAVGSASIASTSTTLIEHWDGTAWSLVSSPNNPNVAANALTSIACRSPLSCFAVGYSYGTRGGVETLVEQLTGLLQINSAARESNGHFVLSGQTLANVQLNIEASADLANFTSIGPTTSDANGIFQFDDAGAASLPKRFYRATPP